MNLFPEVEIMMRLRKCILFYLFIIVTSSINCLYDFDGEPVKVMSFLVPELMINDTEGTFVLITREVERRTGLKFNIVFKPTKRAVEDFKAGEGDMLFPAVEGIYKKKDGIIQSEESFYTKKDYIFTHKNQPIFSDVKELKGLTVGILRGYLDHCVSKDFKAEDRDFKIEETDNLQQSAIKLRNNRIDAFVGEETAVLGSCRILGILDKVHYDKNSPIAIANTYYVFRDTDKGRMLEMKVSAALHEMKSDGTLDSILGN